MAASKFTRNKDYSDDANNNAGGRDTIDPAGLDGEFDEVLAVTDDHADKLDLLLRDDLLMVAGFLQGHEFSTSAVQALAALMSSLTGVAWLGSWVTATDYAVGALVEESGNTYICVTAHTSGTFATDLAASKWEIVAQKGAGASFPGGGTSNDVLYYNGAGEAWGKITALMAPLHALIANPTFTGVVGMPDVNIAGRLNFSIDTVTFVAAGNAFDFDTEFMKTIDVSADYTGACSAANVTQGDVLEVHMTNTKGTDAALLWDSNWTWMGYAPDTLPAGKKAVLSLRAPTGSAATDIIAMWSVEP